MSAGEEHGNPPSSGGTMADHLKRYRDYVGDLKRGQSSGISAAFGRASDLLPPEVMEIKAPPIAAPPVVASTGAATAPLVAQAQAVVSAPVVAQAPVAAQAQSPPPAVGQIVLAPDYDREYLRNTVETLIKDYADGLDDPVGSLVQTSSGVEEVLSVYVENGERMYMLSDLSVINDETFRRDLLQPADTQIQTAPEEPDQSLSPPRQLPRQAQAPTVRQEAQPSTVERLVAEASVTGNALDQSVTTADGANLWQIYYDDGPQLVSMADGGIIKRAEGRSEYVFSRLSSEDGDLKFFILSGFIVDPATGNIYLEANEGAYTAAFLNNGWQVHQYRSHAGEDTYFVSEPMKPGTAPATRQVRSLDLDPATGAVSYETMDSSASITLKSRKL